MLFFNTNIVIFFNTNIVLYDTNTAFSIEILPNTAIFYTNTVIFDANTAIFDTNTAFFQNKYLQRLLFLIQTLIYLFFKQKVFASATWPQDLAPHEANQIQVLATSDGLSWLQSGYTKPQPSHFQPNPNQSKTN